MEASRTIRPTAVVESTSGLYIHVPRNVKFLTISLVITMSSASLIRLGPDVFDQTLIRFARLGGLAIGVVLLVAAKGTASRYFKPAHDRSALMTLWLLFGAVVTSSSIMTSDNTEEVLAALWMSFGVPALLYSLVPSKLDRFGPRAVLVSLILTIFLYMTVSVILEHQVRFLYSGIFVNPNTVGIICSTAFVSLASVTIGLRERKRNRATLLCTIALGVMFVGVLVSGSRTSTLSCMVTSFAIATIAGKKYLRIWLVFLCTVVGIVFWAFQSMGKASEVLAGVVLKQNTQAASSDVLNGRNLIWSEALREVSILGHGSGYFEEHMGVGPHNSFIGVLGERGPIAAVLLFLVACLSLSSVWRFTRTTFPWDPYSLGIFAIVLHFWIVSLTEGLFGSFGTELTIASFVSIGIATRSGQTGARSVVQPKLFV